MSKTPTPDPSPAAAAEANDHANVVVTWRGLTFDIPADRDEWPFAAELAIEEAKYGVAIRELLPAPQYREFLATRPKGGDATELIEAIADALGFDGAGESPASSG